MIKMKLNKLLIFALNESIGNKLDEQTSEFIKLLEKLESKSNGSEELEKIYKKLKIQ